MKDINLFSKTNTNEISSNPITKINVPCFDTLLLKSCNHPLCESTQFVKQKLFVSLFKALDNNMSKNK
jgi:hypothetical protein